MQGFALVESVSTYKKGKCHCGNAAIRRGSKRWPYRMGQCNTCAKVRCDLYPQACLIVSNYQSTHGKNGSRNANYSN